MNELRTPRTATGQAPRYQQVADILTERVRAGRYPVGSFLPTEQDLCQEFRVSRYTVREALRKLIELGLVTRRQGAGSEVLSTEPRGGFAQKMHSLSELYEYAADTVFDISETRIVTADAALSHLLGRTPGCEWLKVVGVRRTREGEPISYTEVYVNSDFRALEPELRGLTKPFYALIEERFGASVEEVIQSIEAETVAPRIARLLGLDGNAWTIKMTRRYLGPGDRPLQASINWHPAADFIYSMSLKRDDPGSGATG